MSVQVMKQIQKQKHKEEEERDHQLKKRKRKEYKTQTDTAPPNCDLVYMYLVNVLNSLFQKQLPC